MAGKLGSLAQEFLDSVGVGDNVVSGKPKSSGVKKRAVDKDSSKPKKVAKIEDLGDMSDIARSGKVSYSTLSFCSIYFIY
jgi:ABC-type molybdenum transport system ATPase subunit/photorepair protein PhrA